MNPKTQKKLLIFAIALAVSGLVSWHLYRQSIYSVINHDPIWISMVTVDGGSISSPNGTTKLYITFHDAGAVHRGNFWTWITVTDWIHGRRLVAEGYSSYAVRYQSVPFPVEWIDEKSFWITFVEQRSIEPQKVLVKLD